MIKISNFIDFLTGRIGLDHEKESGPGFLRIYGK